MKINGRTSTISVHIEKHKRGAVNGLQRHNERGPGGRHSNKNIDDERTADNIALTRGDGSYTKRIDKILNERYTGKGKPRKDAVVMVGVTVNLGGDVAELGEAEQIEVLEFMNDWLTERYPNVISATIHVDETNPHLHFDVVPLTPDGRLSAKDLFGRTQLQILQRESLEAVQEAFGRHGFRRLSDEERTFRRGLNKESFEMLTTRAEALDAELSEVHEELTKMAEANEAKAEALEALQERLTASERHLTAEREELDVERARLDEREARLIERETEYQRNVKLVQTEFRKQKNEIDERADSVERRAGELSETEKRLNALSERVGAREKMAEQKEQQASERLLRATQERQTTQGFQTMIKQTLERFQALMERFRREQNEEAKRALEETSDEFHPLTEDNIEDFGESLAELDELYSPRL